MIKGPFPVEGIEEVWSRELIRRLAPNGLFSLAARLRTLPYFIDLSWIFRYDLLSPFSAQSFPRARDNVKENQDFQNRLRISSPISEPLYSESGVDLTLIRWMLSLTPVERLQALEQSIRSILRLKGDFSNT